jgi:hypothetical protein
MLISEVALKSLVGIRAYAVRAPVAALLAALLASLVTSLLGRTRRGRILATASIGLGVLAGWILLAGFSFKAASPLSRLPAIALVSILGQAALGTRARPKLASAVAVLLSVLGAWWLCGAPHSFIPPWREDLRILAIAMWVLAVVWLARGSDPWRTAAAAAGLAVALHAVGAASPWPLVALVPAAAAFGSLGQAGKTAFLMPAWLAIATAAAAASLAVGGMPHARFGPVEAACLAAPASFWLAGHIGKKFRRPGALQLALTGVLVFSLVSLIALSAAAVGGLR